MNYMFYIITLDKHRLEELISGARLSLASWVEKLGVVRSICRASMFDEGAGIKSQECAGIQATAST